MAEKVRYEREVLKVLLAAEKPLRANNVNNAIVAEHSSAQYHSTLKQLKLMLKKGFLDLDEDTETYGLKGTLSAFLKVAKLCLEDKKLKVNFSKSRYLQKCLTEELWSYIVIQLFIGMDGLWKKLPPKAKQAMERKGFCNGIDSVSLLLDTTNFKKLTDDFTKTLIGFDSAKPKEFVNEQDPRQILTQIIVLSPTALYHALFTPLVALISPRIKNELSMIPLLSDKRLQLYKFEDGQQKLRFDYLYTFFMGCLLEDLITLPELVDSKERAELATRVFDFGQINFDYTLFESPEYKKDMHELNESVLSVAEKKLGKRDYTIISEKFKKFQKKHYGVSNKTLVFSDVALCPYCNEINSFKVRPYTIVQDIQVHCFNCKKFFNVRFIISKKTTKKKLGKPDDFLIKKIKEQKQIEGWAAGFEKEQKLK